MKMLKKIALVLACVWMFSSCYSLTHVVGQGAQGNQVTEARAWYALWGLVPINEVDSKQMAGGATDYTIKTEHTFVDVVISFFTSIASINVKTVEVTK